ncbi:hypothetical protein P2H44_11465 [Albimonas sp. CAU 1670]|uniref:hypothetical protein n=1 Tax=Albimonas sp. CAU 1670 TaxID=3032599 RepID=UPI0023DAECB7|nr:hypothetical protein [Albimonas sp. CAU 1670]MDF2233170.1 hypothetical protein [Albimonas sp. CAU 1670]
MDATVRIRFLVAPLPTPAEPHMLDRVALRLPQPASARRRAGAGIALGARGPSSRNRELAA